MEGGSQGKIEEEEREKERNTGITLLPGGEHRCTLLPTWVLLPKPPAPLPGPCILHTQPSPLGPGHSPLLSMLSVLSIIYGLQATITINNAQAIMFYSSLHNCVSPNVCRAGSWPSACSLFLPQQDLQGLMRRAGLAEEERKGGVRLGGQLCPPPRAACSKSCGQSRPQPPTPPFIPGRTYLSVLILK